MPAPDFIHLRAHSSYSLLEGTLHPKELVALAKRFKMPAVAMVDSQNLFGSLEFSLAASSSGVQPIIACLLNVEYDGIYYPLPVYAKDDCGYHNLLALCSSSFLDTDGTKEPHVALPLLLEKNEGLILLTGGLKGPVSQALCQGKKERATTILLLLKETFGDRLYVEIQRQGIPEEAQIEKDLLALAYEHEIPLVATNEIFFAEPGMHEAQDVLMCIATGNYVTEEVRRRVTKEHYFKSPRQMKELFIDLPEALANTVTIARRCAVMSTTHAPMLPHFPCEEGESEEEEFRMLSKKGLAMRLETQVFTDDMSEAEKDALQKEYDERLEYELGIIIQMQFPGYFLIVSDFIRWSKRENIPVGPGRGSGAGSIVAWALEITDLNPIRFGLLFERFLNPERVSMPDFDIDFCQERREEVIRYVQRKYGKDKVAQIITFGKLQARAVVRDVGRVLQMPYGQIDRISKLIPFNPLEPVTLSKAIEMDKSLSDMQKEDPEVGQLLTIGQKLEGLYRHASTHAAGVVIADRKLQELVPVYRDPRSDMPVSGYSMKYSESAGLVKFDFLGLKTLTVIAKTVGLIERFFGQKIDIPTIPIDDPATFKMLGKGDSTGVFQLESAGMRDTLRKLKPDNIDDIIALISLYRPGPMDNIPSYIARKHGTEEPDYLDPTLEEVLKETYGVIIYQEQVMQIAQVMGGYTLGGADLLRRAMGKKIASEMDKQREIFVTGAKKNGVPEKKASSIFDLVAKFAGYGFNKSHAAAYAMISYQTAYLKANFPVAFLAATMNLEIQDTDKINLFCQETRRQGIKILLPDVNQSDALFLPEQYAKDAHEQDDNNSMAWGIRYGLGALKNVGVDAMKEVVAERNNNGPFTSIFDFAARVPVKALNKRQVENLIRAGGFDALHANRRQIFDGAESILRYGISLAKEKESNQASLFGGSDEGNAGIPAPKLSECIDYQGVERLKEEFFAIGLYLSKHPIEMFSHAMEALKVTSSDMFETLADGSFMIQIAGVVTAKRVKSSARGRYATLMISDPKGLFEVAVYDENLLVQSHELLDPGQLVLMEVNARKDEGGIRLTAQQISSLSEAADSVAIPLHLTLSKSKNQTQHIDDIIAILGSTDQGNSPVTLSLEVDKKKLTLDIGRKKLTATHIQQLRELEDVEVA